MNTSPSFIFFRNDDIIFQLYVVMDKITVVVLQAHLVILVKVIVMEIMIVKVHWYVVLIIVLGEITMTVV